LSLNNQPYVHTLTSDNGREFTEHEEISLRFATDFYLARPYASWQRGTNENTNGLIRRYFPKNRDFTTITQQEINLVMKRLNNRPRKRLAFSTPVQGFLQSVVALRT
jgi:IS30 family transposase